MGIQKVAVIGAGTMGIGIAVDLVLHDFTVILVDNSLKALKNSEKEIENNIRFASLYNKAVTKSKNRNELDNIIFTTEIEDVSSCDFIIENVVEDWEIKKNVYRQIDNICKSEVIFGVDTSCISITRIGSVTKRESKVIGIHFMNPVFMKSSVEVIRGFHTSEECINETKDFLRKLNKEAIIVNDFPGFVSNRISHLFMNEAAFVVQDQVAEPREIDEIFKKCYGHAMGPLETADLIGLDTVVDSLEVLYSSYQDTKFRCCPLLKKMVAAGLLGKKSGKGFYNYSNNR